MSPDTQPRVECGTCAVVAESLDPDPPDEDRAVELLVDTHNVRDVAAVLTGSG